MSAPQQSSRIPLALQQVFVSSQRGEDVKNISAPSNGVGFKLFNKKGKAKKPRSQGSKTFKFSSLFLERLGSRISSAAEATRKAMKGNKKPQVVNKPKGVKASLESGLDKVLKERGYSIQRYCSLEGGYHCRPTTMQQASHGSRLAQAVRASDEALVQRLLDAGLSPNPCNHFGESLIHLICRRGDHNMLKVMLEAGCSLQISDDYGRTPLHDACWGVNPSFETVLLILESDRRLIHVADCRGATPLSYVKKENYRAWVEFLQSNMDMIWPERNLEVEGEERPPPLALLSPHSLPIPDPDGALPLELAEMVANGRLEPEDAMGWDEDSSDEEYDSEDDDEDDDESYDSEYDSDEDSYFSDESSIDEDEMAEICMRAGGAMAVARRVFEKEMLPGGGVAGGITSRIPTPQQIPSRAL